MYYYSNKALCVKLLTYFWNTIPKNMGSRLTTKIHGMFRVKYTQLMTSNFKVFMKKNLSRHADLY